MTLLLKRFLEKQTYFDKRSLYYSSEAYSSQIAKGEPFTKLKPVYFVGILNFSLFAGHEDYISRHLILEKESLTQYLKDMEFAFIEISKFQKEEDQLNHIIDQWTYFLKEAPNLKVIPEIPCFC